MTVATTPICSICIANFNGEHLLDDCLSSIFDQIGNISVEIIVHDDASSDGSLAILDKYPDVIRIASTENVGFCVANNRMVALARGEFVLLLNNDAALHQDALQTLLENARKPKAAILTLPQYDWQTENLVDRGCLQDLFYNPVPNIDLLRTDLAYVIGACLWIPRALWQELGGFPAWLESIGEDMYLCCTARLMGNSVRATTSSGYRHRQGASFGGNRVNDHRLATTYRRRYLSERNKIAVMTICTPTWLMWPLLAIHCMALGAEGGLVSLLRRDRRVWRDIYSASLCDSLRNRDQLVKRRREIQMKRRISLHAYFSAFVWVPRKLILLYRYGIPTIRESR